MTALKVGGGSQKPWDTWRAWRKRNGSQQAYKIPIARLLINQPAARFQ